MAIDLASTLEPVLTLECVASDTVLLDFTKNIISNFYGEIPFLNNFFRLSSAVGLTETILRDTYLMIISRLAFDRVLTSSVMGIVGFLSEGYDFEFYIGLQN